MDKDGRVVLTLLPNGRSVDNKGQDIKSGIGKGCWLKSKFAGIKKL